MSRKIDQTASSLDKILITFKTIKKMVDKSLDPGHPLMVSSLPKNREKIDQIYLEVCILWEGWKSELDLSDIEFNNVSDGVPDLPYNDQWKDDFDEAYYDLVDRSDHKINETPNVDPDIEEKVSMERETKLRQDKKYVETLSTQLELLCDSISSGTGRIKA